MEGGDEFVEKESIAEVKRKIDTGEYHLVAKEGPRVKSNAWGKFKLVFVRTTNADTGAVCCVHCGEVKYCDRAKGTSLLTRHKCPQSAPQVVGPVAPFDERPKIEASPAVKRSFKDATIDFCAMDYRPYYSVAGKGLTRLVQKAIDVGAEFGRVNATTLMPNPTTVSRGAAQRADLARSQLMPEVIQAAKGGYVAATTDIWKDDYSKLNYITVTVHYFSETWNLHSYVLFTLPLSEEEKTGVNIRDDLKTEFAVLGVSDFDFTKIVFITDGGSNVVKAMEGNLRLYCMAHLLNLVVRRTFTVKLADMNVYGGPAGNVIQAVHTLVTLSKEKPNSKLGKVFAAPNSKLTVSKVESLERLFKNFNEVRQELEVTNESHWLEVIKREELEDIINILKPIETEFLKHAGGTGIPGRSLKHVLPHLKQNEEDSSFANEIKKFLSDEIAILEAVEQIELCKALVAYVKRASQVFDLPRSLKQDVETRWNSQLTMLKSIHDNMEEIIDVLGKKGQLDKVEGIDKPKLAELIAFLGPFQVETDRLQGEKAPTLQIPLLTYHRLKKHCTIVHDSASAMAHKIRNRADQELDLKVRERLTVRHKIATFLHPSYRHLRMLPEEERGVVHQAVRLMCARVPTTGAEAGPAQAKRPRVSNDDLDDWRDDSDDDVENDDVTRYLSDRKGDDGDLAKWWKDKADNYPTLSKVARQVLAAPATSAASERVFSSTGYTVTARRSNLCPESVNSLTFLHHYYAEIGLPGY